MGLDMILRELYLPADTKLDSATATEIISQLCRTATLNDLRALADNGWLQHADLQPADDWSDQHLTAHAPVLRTSAERRLHQLLGAFATSLRGRDVIRWRFDTNPNTAHGVDAYVTGGLTAGDAPTDAFEAWDLVFETEAFPDGWCDRIGAACGFLHPRGDGSPATTVTFHAWSVQQ